MCFKLKKVEHHYVVSAEISYKPILFNTVFTKDEPVNAFRYFFQSGDIRLKINFETTFNINRQAFHQAFKKGLINMKDYTNENIGYIIQLALI